MKIVFFTGAGVSAESGINTFRDSGGLWEEHSIYDVATPEAWQRNPELVLRFYNERRKQMASVEPNLAHKAIAELEKHFEITVITQNVDDLHERAGSRNVVHLHGELRMARSSKNESLLYDFTNQEIKLGDTCEEGSQLRPHVVWFGEMVPKIVEAEEIVKGADLFVVVGSSMQVYPAAGLISNTPSGCEHFYIDPQPSPLRGIENLTIINEKASLGVPKLAQEFKSRFL
jgi:NAD-dependent deacetylase